MAHTLSSGIIGGVPVGTLDSQRGVKMYICAGTPGLPEMLIILVIVVIFFGVGKLPNVMGQMGE